MPSLLEKLSELVKSESPAPVSEPEPEGEGPQGTPPEAEPVSEQERSQRVGVEGELPSPVEGSAREDAREGLGIVSAAAPARAVGGAPQQFTSEAIGKMSPEQYEANRAAVLSQYGWNQ